MQTRKLVKGSYTNASTYVLTTEDGAVFKTIEEGRPFFIGNQFRAWHPIRVPQKNRKGTILMCRKFGDNGKIIEEFPLIHNKRGLWALTSGAARNGVFHNYREPQCELEKQLASMGLSRRIVKVINTPYIEGTLNIGGQLCNHVINPLGYDCITDGSIKTLSQPEYASENHENEQHRGCIISTYRIKITGATYIIYYNINEKRKNYIEMILLSAKADTEKVVEELKKL